MTNEMKLARHFNEILDAIHEDLMITDGKGVVLRVSSTFQKMYNISDDYAVGKTVYQLEDEGYFKPSIVAMVINSGKNVTAEQITSKKRTLVVTATPVYDKSGSIMFIVSFSRDITEILQLQRKYSRMESKVKRYAEEIDRLRRESGALAGGAVGRSAQMIKIFDTIKRIADFDANVLFLGPSGVGKTMLSRMVHENSCRKNGPFVEINCAAIPENLLESELFGYEKGSFTGASNSGKKGLIETADGGTLLLDEISEIPVNLQAKLLKTIQDKEITRIGGTKPVKVDFRLIAASNRDLEEYAERGLFRRDLYYRLNVINIDIPPLCERKEDILLLTDHFLNKYNEKYGMKKSFKPAAVKLLMDYSWPGNVRELANVIERAFMISTDDIMGEDTLPAHVFRPREDVKGNIGVETVTDLERAVEEFEGSIIRYAYEKYRTSVGVAGALNISQSTAYRKILKYISKERENRNNKI